MEKTKDPTEVLPKCIYCNVYQIRMDYHECETRKEIKKLLVPYNHGNQEEFAKASDKLIKIHQEFGTITL